MSQSLPSKGALRLAHPRPLIDVFAQIPDPRDPRERRYSLPAVRALATAATLCGYRSYSAMAEWGRNYGAELAAALGFRRGTLDREPSGSQLPEGSRISRERHAPVF